MQKRLLVFCRTEFLLVLFLFDGLEACANIVVVHLELQQFFVADGFGNYIRMKFLAEDAGDGLRA
jgi:hypothetical protein